MRKQNSEFRTAFTSEANHDLKNTDYFGFVELDDFACYVIADGIDDQNDAKSARLAVAAVVSRFQEAPSMNKRTMKACLKAANTALLEARSKMRLKASVIIILTNYVSMRYGQAGNIRMRLYRDGFLKLRTTDQSLTSDMIQAERVEADQVAVHAERNNLYAYLGQAQEFHPYVSKKIKLSGADAIALYTRGIWEHIDEGELSDVFADATDEPEKSVGEVEELLLSRQPQDLAKYTFVTLFINKTFTDPNRKRRIKRIIAIVIPILIILVTLTIILMVRYNKKMERIRNMEVGYTDTIEYIQADNYVRAEERCKDTKELAEQLKDHKMQGELGNYLKLIETILAADDKMDNKKYADAQTLYKDAANRARYVDNLGLDYILNRLALTANYLSVYDLINLGDTLALNLQYDKAEEKYLEAKNLAGKIYFDEGRASAISALEQLYTNQKAEKEADNNALKEQLARQEAGANHAAKGDEAFAQGDYQSAKVHYSNAEQNYADLGDEIQRTAVAAKLTATESKLTAQAGQVAQAEGYIEQAGIAQSEDDFIGAKKYYLLARDIYASLKMTDKVDEIGRKMELLDLEESQAAIESSKAEAESIAESEAASKAFAESKAAAEKETASSMIVDREAYASTMAQVGPGVGLN